jgi:predicted nucleic acid-binding protein
MPVKAKVFLDTSVIFAAVFSPEGGSHLLFRLGEIGLLDLWVGPSVLTEADEVVRRKAPQTLPDLAFLLSMVHISTGSPPGSQEVERVRKIVDYLPDARVLAEALRVAQDWFVTLDQKHFIENRLLAELPFRIGSPGDFLEAFKQDFRL